MSNKQAGSSAPKPREPKRPRELDAAVPQHMLEDHPFLVPGITLILAGLCIYGTVFSNVMRDIMAGPNAGREQLGNINSLIGWTAAFAFAGFALAGIFLVLNTIGHAIRVSKRQPLTCPQCGNIEDRPGQFPRDRIKDTPWTEAMCPNCGNKWYARVD